MSDQFVDVIKSGIDALSSSNGFGWFTYIQASPRRSEWNNFPCVIIVPSNKDKVEYMAFQAKNVQSSYQVFLVTENDLINTLPADHDLFVRGMILTFMPVNQALINVGAWDSRVEPDFDFDRNMFPSGASISCVTINISWIF